MTDPAAEYRRRLDARRAEHARLERLDARYASMRLAVFSAAAVLLWASATGRAGAWWLLAPVAAFLVLVVRHDRVLRAHRAAGRAVRFYELGLARLEDRWMGLGSSGERFRDDAHPYANDLDLFGRGSIFELISIARTGAGEETLAGWLLQPAAPDVVGGRQAAVQELAPLLDLREAVAVAGSAVGTRGDRAALVAWATAPRVLSPTWLRGVAVACTALLLASAGYWIATGVSAWFLGVVALQMLAVAPIRAAVDAVLHGATGPAADLDIVVELLQLVERQTFTSPALAALQQRLGTGGVPASRAVAGLHTLVERHDWQHNPFFAPVSALLLWGTHLAWAIEAWRAAHGNPVAGWLEALGTAEALVSISAYRYEHPDHPFPTVEPLSSSREALIDGVALGHPIIPAARRVANDVHLDAATPLLVVSGSNMSGKSTLMRTVGVNVVLALAGAPVCARALRLTPVVIGATLRIQDSLQEGRSRFYAEITRLRDITVRAEGPEPLLFLLDELFHGTNSHDRVIGAEGVLKYLIDRGAIGFVTTHDLALTAVADRLAPRARNVHFEDWFDQGDLHFDYRMKEGPVTRSNAVALMRAVGLPVEGA